MNIDWLYGVFHLTFWSYAVIAFVMVQTTLMATTLYLHRDAAHRSIDLHPVLRHFFRFWIWMTSSMLTREWVAVHRKHHVYVDRPGDPHSPVVLGLRRILLEGTEAYRLEARNPDTQAQYGAGTPDDWVERNLYSRHRNAGIVFFVTVSLLLFGVPGIILIAVQMISMPVLAAGVINGLGHSVGYRSFEVDDASTNIVPWGLLIGGEELHNNHHAFPSSAKFSVQSWEFDLGWLYVVALKSLGLAKVNRLAPAPDLFRGDVFRADVLRVGQRIGDGDVNPDWVYTVIRNRMHVLRAYATQVVLPVLERERHRGLSASVVRVYRKLLIRSPVLLDANARRRLMELLESHPPLKTVYECQEQLRQLWNTINPTKDNLVGLFKTWCARAEASGVDALSVFAARLRGNSSIGQGQELAHGVGVPPVRPR